MTSGGAPSTSSGLFGGKSKLIAVIGDEVRQRSPSQSRCYSSLQDTVTGFLLGGIGELNAKTRKPNFLIVDKSSFVRSFVSLWTDRRSSSD